MLQQPDFQVFFFIIIPTFNRPEHLASCLQRICELTYPKALFEVIVVDDGSRCCLKKVVRDHKAKLNLRLLRQDNAGPATARNTGAQHARGQFLAFMDDDCRPDKAWLNALALQLKKSPNALAGGKTINLLTNNLYAEASQQIVSFLYGYFQARKSPMQFFTSNNMVIPARKFKEIGGFNTSFPLAAAEDREFCSNWIFSGGTMAYVPDAIMGHVHALNLTSYFRQHLNYGRGAFIFNRIQKLYKRPALKPAPLSFYTQLLLSPIQEYESWPKGCVISGLIFLSQVANALGFFYEKYRQKRLRKWR